MTRFGGYSDTVVIPAIQAIPYPSNLTAAEAASMPVTALTAWMMLEVIPVIPPDLRPQFGERVRAHVRAQRYAAVAYVGLGFPVDDDVLNGADG